MLFVHVERGGGEFIRVYMCFFSVGWIHLSIIIFIKGTNGDF